MNKKLLILLPALSLMLAACASGQKKDDGGKTDPTPAVVSVEAVTLSETSKTMDPGDTLDLRAVVTPTTLTERGVNWSSDTPAVATVSEGGRVTAISAGTAKIKAAAKADTTKFAECTITVNKAMVIAGDLLPDTTKTYKWGLFQQHSSINKKIYFDGKTQSGSSYYFTTTDIWEDGVDVKFEAAAEGTWNVFFVEGEAKKYINIGATDHHLSLDAEAKTNWTWDEEYKTIKAVGASNGDLYFPGTYNDFSTISGCAFSMIDQDYVSQFYLKVEPTKATQITIYGAKEVYAGGSLQLKTQVGPVGASLNPVTWNVAGNNKATISATGLLEVEADAEIDSTVKVTASVDDITSDEFIVTVKEKLNYGTKEEPITVEEAIALIDKLDRPNPSVEKAYVTGVVGTNKGQSNGKFSEIWATNADGSTKKAFEFYNPIAAEGVDVSAYSDVDSLVGKEVVVYGKLAYYSGTYEMTSPEIKVNGQSQDPKVYDSAQILAIKEGSRHATSVALSETEAFEMEQGEEKTLTAEALPYGSLEHAITWSKSGTAADKVTLANGKVTVAEDAVAGTSVTITATAKEGVEASVTITVKEKPADITKVKYVMDTAAAADNITANGNKLSKNPWSIDEVASFSWTPTEDGKNTGKFYKSNDYGWQLRLYKSESAKFTVTVKSGYTLTAVTVNFMVNAGSWWAAGTDNALTVNENSAVLDSTGYSGNLALYYVEVSYKLAA